MNTLHFSDNIIRLRRKKGITQEELAAFIGVTKASVSKWETKQSLPDILLLPQLAAFFDVTVDELLGYEPQLSKEQIQNIYHNLASEFGSQPFEAVMEKCRKFVKKYYSCYPFLLQMCVLYLNHFMLADEPKRQAEILTAASDLCCHIIEDCHEIGLCNDATIVKASIDLLLQKPQEAIDALEEAQNPYRFSRGCDTILVQAYELAGETEKADRFIQISMFAHLLSFIESSVQYLTLHREEPERCAEIIRRTDSLLESFQLDRLHPNTSAAFHYETAVIYCMQKKPKEALERLQRYARLVHYLLDNHLFLHGDSYFPLLDTWFEQADLGINAPRNKKVIWDSAIQTLCSPIFSILESEKQFQSIKESFTKKGENL